MTATSSVAGNQESHSTTVVSRPVTGHEHPNYTSAHDSTSAGHAEPLAARTTTLAASPVASAGQRGSSVARTTARPASAEGPALVVSMNTSTLPVVRTERLVTPAARVTIAAARPSLSAHSTSAGPRVSPQKQVWKNTEAPVVRTTPSRMRSPDVQQTDEETGENPVTYFGVTVILGGICLAISFICEMFRTSRRRSRGRGNVRELTQSPGPTHSYQPPPQLFGVGHD